MRVCACAQIYANRMLRIPHACPQVCITLRLCIPTPSAFATPLSTVLYCLRNKTRTHFYSVPPPTHTHTNNNLVSVCCFSLRSAAQFVDFRSPFTILFIRAEITFYRSFFFYRNLYFYSFYIYFTCTYIHIYIRTWVT